MSLVYKYPKRICTRTTMIGPPSVGVTAEAYNKINAHVMHKDFSAVKMINFIRKK